MTSTRQIRNRSSGISLRAATTALALTIALGLAVVASQAAQAQAFNVLHNFTNGLDGGAPVGLTMDRAGNLYGTAQGGGLSYGTVFELKRAGSGWIFNRLYSFSAGNDGANPNAGVIFGRDGSLYGTTLGGGGTGSGTVFNLRPPPTACNVALCDWTETILYRFRGGSDGGGPGAAVVFDQTGNLYGTTEAGGAGNCQTGCGVVFKLTPSNGNWTERALYQFSGSADGAFPWAPVTFDKAGNLYGTTSKGGNLACNSGYGCGGVFQLTPSGAGWTESTLYSFQDESDGAFPFAGLTFDQSGNLYGATTINGSGGAGTVFELTNGSWAFNLLYSFSEQCQYECGPVSALVMDNAGNLYGTTYLGGAYLQGSVFKLTPSDGIWTYSVLHDFTGGADGGLPYGGVVLDANGNLYGTALIGGERAGVVWEITP